MIFPSLKLCVICSKKKPQTGFIFWKKKLCFCISETNKTLKMSFSCEWSKKLVRWEKLSTCIQTMIGGVVDVGKERKNETSLTTKWWIAVLENSHDTTEDSNENCFCNGNEFPSYQRRINFLDTTAARKAFINEVIAFHREQENLIL